VTYQIKPRSFLRELLIVIVFLFNSICAVVSKLIPSIRDFGDALIFIVVLLGMANCLLSRKVILRKFLLINIAILLFAIGSFALYGFNGEIGLLLVNYFIWGVIISFFVTLEYDVKRVMNIALVLSSFFLAVYLFHNSAKKADSMAWTYGVFPCLSVCLTHMVFMKDQLGKIKWALYLPSYFICLQFVLDANRGGWVSMILLVYFLTIKVKIKQEPKMRNRVLWNLLFLTLIFVAVFLYEPIIKLLYEITTALDIRFYAIEKTYRGILADNVTNNRTELYDFAWKGFLSSPVWGHGIGAFSVNHGGWPHNFFLQLLYEGGILLFLLVLGPLVRIVWVVVRTDRITPAEYALFVCFFANSIPKLLFSTQVWNVQGFWLLLAFGMMLLIRIQHNAQEEITE